MKNPIDFKKDKPYLFVIGILLIVLMYGFVSSLVENIKLNAALDEELKAYKKKYNPFPPLSEEERNKHIKNIFGDFDRLEKTEKYSYEYCKVYKDAKFIGYVKKDMFY